MKSTRRLSLISMLCCNLVIIVCHLDTTVPNNKLNKSTFKCFNPSSSELEKQYLKYFVKFKNLEDLINIPMITKHISSDLVISQFDSVSSKETFVYGNQECNTEVQDIQENMALCPWHTTLQYRLDRYPYLQAQAVCNCHRCKHAILKNAFEHTCQKYTVLRPVLKKGACINGVFKWFEALEPVSIACLCQTEKDIAVNDVYP